MKLTQLQTLLFIFLGVVFWLNAVLIIRYFGESVFSQGSSLLSAFWAITIVITVVTVYILKIVSKLRFDELLKPLVIMTVTATILDGIALTWFRSIYSQSYEVALYGAATILWGAGLGLLFGYLLESKVIRLDK